MEYTKEQIISIKIHYTPIFENINGKKFVQKRAEVKCENEKGGGQRGLMIN